MDRIEGRPKPTRYASVLSFDPHFVELHSTAPMARKPKKLKTFREVLRSWQNQSLWKYLKFDGNGEWIRRGLMLGTIIFVHDGSYMQKVDPYVCSAALRIKCRKTGKTATCTLVERSVHADNYRGEALGAMAALLILKAATVTAQQYMDCEDGYCDNKGVVIHCNDPNRILPEKQSQADLILLCKQLARDLPFRLTYKHVMSHLDKVLRWDQLTEEQQMNVEVDKLAEKALLAAIVNRDFIDMKYPFEEIVLTSNGTKSVGSSTLNIYRWWGYRIAREFYATKKTGCKIRKEDFDLVYWEGLGRTMRRYPKMYRTWITKQMCGVCGCNEHMSRYRKAVSNICPACGKRGESVAHITVCKNKDRTSLYNSSVDDLNRWMSTNETDPTLHRIVVAYLRGRGSKDFSDLTNAQDHSKYHLLAEYQDRLGWQNFIEGRFTSYLVHIQREYLRASSTWRTAESWASGLMDQLLRITHRQWLHRNARVHFRLSDGRTQAQHDEIVAKIGRLIWTDPDELLEKDRRLLRVDFKQLGRARATTQECWIAEMETAVHLARWHSKDQGDGADTGSAGRLEPDVDTEGSIKYRRRKKK